MSSIQSKTKDKNYEVEIKSKSGHTLIADEPEDLGGENKGMSPDELIIAALAACTSATLKMYAQRKEWDLQEVKTSIKFVDAEKKNEVPSIETEIELIGKLDSEQKERLMVIAGKCPIHKMLSTGLTINSSMV